MYSSGRSFIKAVFCYFFAEYCKFYSDLSIKIQCEELIISEEEMT